MMTVFIEDSFDSAHFLPNVPPGHKCEQVVGSSGCKPDTSVV
ncbi:MAG TPA: hypothetical protein VN579_07445 [Bryobacteraceae bacterium]|nr:hypothetical protein [Bryobacteraceae bacterium]